MGCPVRTKCPTSAQEAAVHACPHQLCPRREPSHALSMLQAPLHCCQSCTCSWWPCDVATHATHRKLHCKVDTPCRWRKAAVGIHSGTRQQSAQTQAPSKQARLQPGGAAEQATRWQTAGALLHVHCYTLSQPILFQHGNHRHQQMSCCPTLAASAAWMVHLLCCTAPMPLQAVCSG